MPISIECLLSCCFHMGHALFFAFSRRMLIGFILCTHHNAFCVLGTLGIRRQSALFTISAFFNELLELICIYHYISVVLAIRDAKSYWHSYYKKKSYWHSLVLMCFILYLICS